MANVGEHCMVKGCRSRRERHVLVSFATAYLRGDLPDIELPDLEVCAPHGQEITGHPEEWQINWDSKGPGSLLVRKGES